MHTIALASQKGGSGKSTLAIGVDEIRNSVEGRADGDAGVDELAPNIAAYHVLGARPARCLILLLARHRTQSKPALLF